MQDYERFFIDGSWVPTCGADSIDVLNAATEDVMGRVPEGTLADVDAAAAAAAAAFDGWSRTSREERKNYLSQITEALSARSDELVTTIAGEAGSPLWFCQLAQVGLPLSILGTYPTILDEAVFEETVGHSLVLKEPVGVVGCITPWNFPLHQIIAKLAPALAAGCTVVVKPSELAPLSAFVLAEIIESVGLPPGVFNLVSGYGPTVGEAMAAHPLIDMISFTGSTRTGTRISQLAAPSIKRVALELGGKSANLILDDADFSTAVSDGVGRAFINSGQACAALTRMLVPAGRLDEAAEIAEAEVKGKWRLTDPFSGEFGLGPLVSDGQRARVRSYIAKGLDEGAELVTGGVEPPPGLERGYYVAPTVFTNVDNAMTIAREEIFGPVVSILEHHGDEDAIRIANDSSFGLAGAVWSNDIGRAKHVARQIRTGQVYVNGAPFNPLAPFGGYKMSGNGREFGTYGLDEYLEIKSVQLPE